MNKADSLECQPLDSKIRKCLRCGKEVVGFFLCKRCIAKNKSISEAHTYSFGSFNGRKSKTTNPWRKH